MKKITLPIILIFTCFISTSGCALLDPHGRGGGLNDDNSKSIKASGIDYGSKFAGQLGIAIDRANLLRENYFQKCRDESYQRNLIGMSIVPLSASALYLGFASSANADLAVALGLTSAGLYGFGKNFTSKPRQTVYLEGSRAIGCAIYAMGPLLYTQADYDDLKEKLRSSITSVRTALNAAGDVEKVLGYLTAEDKKIARSEIEHTNELIELLKKTRKQALLLKRRIDTSAVTLDKTIEDIATRVSNEILKTEPDLSSLMAIASSLGGWAGKFGHVPDVVPQGINDGKDFLEITSGTTAQSLYVGETKLSDLKTAKDKLSDLKTENSKFAVEIQVLADHVIAASEIAKNSGSLEECNIAPVDLGFSIFPDRESIELTQGSSTSLSITDRSGIPRVSLSTPDQEAVKLVLDSTAGFISVRVAASENAKPGKHYNLHIANSTMQDIRNIPIEVKEKVSSSDEMISKKCTDANYKDLLETSEKNFLKTVQDVKKVQNILKVKEDGCVGEETRKAIAKYQTPIIIELGIGSGAVPEMLEILTDKAHKKLLKDNKGTAGGQTSTNIINGCNESNIFICGKESFNTLEDAIKDENVVILLRHAQAHFCEKKPCDDQERPLTSCGEKQANAISKAFKKLSITPNSKNIFVSSYIRTEDTAKIIFQDTTVEDKLRLDRCNNSEPVINEVLNNVNSEKGNTVLITHGECITTFLNNFEKVPKFNVKGDENTGVAVFLDRSNEMRLIGAMRPVHWKLHKQLQLEPSIMNVPDCSNSDR